MKTDYVSEIIRRYFANDYPPEMEKKLQAWLIDEEKGTDNDKTASNPEAPLKDKAMFQIWTELEATNDENARHSLEIIKQKLGFKERRETRKRRNIFSAGKYAHRYTVLFFSAAVCLFCIPGGWYYFSAQTEWTTVTTPYGKSAECVLPDNSKVWINPGSTLSYPERFKGNLRQIRLSGEARLTVTKDSGKPFIVQTNTCTIQVLGTVFRISDYPENQQATVCLEEGKIEVRLPHGKKYTLSPNRKMIIDKESRSIRIVPIEITTWEEENLSFEDAPLHDIFQALKRHYGIPIVYRDFHPDKDRYSIKFYREDTPEQALDLLQTLTENFIWSKKNNQIIIHPWHK